MPKVSRESAAHVESHGPVEDRHEDLDDYTINFLTFGQTIDATPLFKGLPAHTGATSSRARSPSASETTTKSSRPATRSTSPRATTRSSKQEPNTSSSARATNCAPSPTS